MVNTILSWFTKGEVPRKVKMPALVIVANLEEAIRLQRISDPSKKLVIHSPGIIKRYSDSAVAHDGVKRITIRSRRVMQAMTKLYKGSTHLEDDTEKERRSLEQRIAETAERRDQDAEKLAQAANSIVPGSVRSEDQVKEVIRNLLTMQFECPEHFIREAIQNADGSWENKKDNRIDVYIDEHDRTVRVEDNGCGMTPDVVDKYFFTIFASQNQQLEYAAGKFGIGAVSFFGLDHEYVAVDSKPRKGEGGRVVINDRLEKQAVSTTTRETPGTTVEIKLKQSSEVDFNKVMQILREDCRYIETPLYVHRQGKLNRLNRRLDPENSNTTLSFKEGSIEGFIKKAPAGRLDLLDHRIRLSSISTKGYSGAVNCSELDTTFSRDSVVGDPVLEKVLHIVDEQRKKLEKGEVSKEVLSLEARTRNYHAFISDNLYLDGAPNERWVRENFQTFNDAGWELRFPHSIGGGALGALVGAVPGAALPLAGVAIAASPLAGFFYGVDKLGKKKYSHRTWLDVITKVGIGIAGLAATIGVCGLIGWGEIKAYEQLFTPETRNSIKDALETVFLGGAALGLGAGLTYGVAHDARHHITKRLANKQYRRLEEEAGRHTRKKSILEYIPIVRDMYHQMRAVMPQPATIARKIINGVKYATMGAAVVAVLGGTCYGVNSAVNESGLRDRIAETMIKIIGPPVITPPRRPGKIERLLAYILPQRTNSINFGDVTHKWGGYYGTRKGLAGLLRLSRRRSSGGSGTVFICDNCPTKHTFNALSNVEGNPLWQKEEPEGVLKVTGWRVEIPEDIEQEGTLEERLSEVREHILGSYEYDMVEDDGYPDLMTAIATEKKAICSSANTYAAMLLNQLGVNNVTYNTGNNHAWLEINYGTKEVPDWKVFDVTPTKINPELEAMMNAPYHEGTGMPYLILLMAAFGAAGIATVKIRSDRKRLREPYTGELSAYEQGLLGEVRQELSRLGDVTACYGVNLNEEHKRFYMSRGLVVLNRSRDIDAKMVALGYAAKMLRDKVASTKIAEEYLETR